MVWIRDQFIPVGFYSRKQVVELLGWRAGNRQEPDGLIGTLPIFEKKKIDKLAQERKAVA